MTIEKHERSTKDLVKAAVSGWLGTALEFMDFQLYSLGAALVFHEIFFPESSTAMALILAMGTYGAGYVARIVGAFIFGKMGDRIGRKKVLFITITMMGICTTLIGVLPTYAQIGVFAPILLVTLRIIQVNRPGFPGECFICELRLPDHRFRWKHNKLFLLLPEEYGPAFPAIVDCYTSPPT
ncbi:transport protein [Escherichia coli O145:H28]|nr:transport protein [Escherichia coli O145:H28]